MLYALLAFSKMLCKCLALTLLWCGVRQLLGKAEEVYEERLLEGRLLLFSRSGVFQVRVYKGDRRYIYKSLKTGDLKTAREEALRVYYEIEYRKRERLPLQSKRFGDVLREYVLFRRQQNQRGTHSERNKKNQQQTSNEMLRQIERVSKFWLEYAGNKQIERGRCCRNAA
ncbi:MAG: hypothetical protein RLZ26_2320 [Pseudomonadota bacterium]